MMFDCSSMRMQSTSCCLVWVASIMAFSSAVITPSSSPVALRAARAAPQAPRAHAGGLLNGIGQPSFLGAQRGDGPAATERLRPVLDARVDLGVDGAKNG